MGMVIQDVELSQEQLDSIVPVIDAYSKKSRINKQQMERDCLAAMQKAGCPLQSDVQTKVSNND